MNLNDRISVLIQAAELSQKNGSLSLDEASIAKYAIDMIKKNKSIKECVEALIKIAQIGQTKGAYTLKDAYYIYVAISNIDEELNKLSSGETDIEIEEE